MLLLPPLLAASASSAHSTPAAAPAPAKLHADTVAVFNRYQQLTEERNETELKRGSPLLWIDSLPEPQRTEAYAALKGGEVQSHRIQPR